MGYLEPLVDGLALLGFQHSNASCGGPSVASKTDRSCLSLEALGSGVCVLRCLELHVQAESQHPV